MSPRGANLAILGLMLLLVVCYSSSVVGLLVKNLVDLFAIGHSPVKIFLLLIYVLFTLLAFRSPLATPRALVLKVFASLLALGWAISLAEFGWFCRTFELPVWDWSAALRQGHWSSNTLTHIHTSKAPLALFFGFLAGSTDPGYPFVPFFPQGLLVGQLAIILTTGVCSWLVALRAFRTRRPGEATTLTLCCFTLVKSTVDGGPLHPEVWAALAVALSLVAGKRSARVAWAAIPFYLALIGGPLWWTFWRIPVNLAALALPMAVERFSARLGIRAGVLGLGLLALTFSPCLLWASDASTKELPYGVNLLDYGLTPLAQGSTVGIFLPNPRDLPASLELLELHPLGNASQVSARLRLASTPLELSAALDLPLSWRLISWDRHDLLARVAVRPLAGRLALDFDSPLLRESSATREGDFTVFLLRLRPGATLNTVMALLGPQLAVLKGMELEPYPSPPEDDRQDIDELILPGANE